MSAALALQSSRCKACRKQLGIMVGAVMLTAMSLRLAWWVVARVSSALLASASSSAAASAAPSVGSVPLPTFTGALTSLYMLATKGSMSCQLAQ